MRKKKVLMLLLGFALAIVIVACGNTESNKKNSNAKTEVKSKENIEKTVEETGEGAEDETVEEVPTSEVIQEEQTSTSDNQNTQSTDNTKQSSKTNPAKNSSTGVNKANATTPADTPATNTVQATTPTCEHQWNPVTESYDLVKTPVYGCNGCGYPLFTINESGAQNIEDLYFHPACYSEKLGMDCDGGGFHSETYTRGYCYVCHGKVSYRQCMFTEMGKRCAKNEALGAYKKVEFNQNHFMYLEVCECGKNLLMRDGVTQKGLIQIKEVCSICGVEKEQ